MSTLITIDAPNRLPRLNFGTVVQGTPVKRFTEKGAPPTLRFQIIGDFAETPFMNLYEVCFPRIDTPEEGLALMKTVAFSNDILQGVLLNEAEVLEAVSGHPAFPEIYAKGTHDGIAFIIMEKIEGVTLEAIIDKKKDIAFSEVVRITLEVLGALMFLHGKNLAHHDVKPANIMIDNNRIFRLLDFGTARNLGSEIEGSLWGTPSYMAPEQALEDYITPRNAKSDLYALGLVIYEMLALAPAKNGSNYIEVIRSHLDPVPDLDESLFLGRLPRDISSLQCARFSEIVRRFNHIIKLTNGVSTWERLTAQQLQTQLNYLYTLTKRFENLLAPAGL